MANEIVARENGLFELRLLLTQNRLYARAKIALGVQLLLVVAVPGALLIVQQRWPDTRIWGALYGLVIAVADIAVLEAIKVGFRRRAASIQEWFDCNVLRLAWSDLKSGRKPDLEDVILASEADPRFDELELRNWYATQTTNLPEYVGRIVCQRSNCWWDSKLRRWYRYLILGLSIGLVVLVVALGVVLGKTMPDFILGLLAPALPIVLWGIREARAHAEAADRADRLKAFGDTLWNQTLGGQLSENTALILSREFQDEIHAHRRQSPLVFDWFYRLFRKKFEQQMGSSVSAMADEAHAAGLH